MSENFTQLSQTQLSELINLLFYSEWHGDCIALTVLNKFLLASAISRRSTKGRFEKKRR